jgi:Leucine-rich repeat (LRR) protein
LEILAVSYGKISRVAGLEGLSNLQELKLDHNRISRIQGFDDLNSLESLDLSFNSIERINNLDKLENLDSLTSLSNLYIIANPIHAISSNTYRLLASNRVAIYAYEGSNHIDIDTFMKRNGIEFLHIRPVESETNRASNTQMRSNQ